MVCSMLPVRVSRRLGNESWPRGVLVYLRVARRGVAGGLCDHSQVMLAAEHDVQRGAKKQRCKGASPYEPRFQRTIAAIFALASSCGGLRNGSVVDSGAHVGGESCLYAGYAPDRIVHAIDPLRANVEIMRKLYKDRVNLIPLQAGLGSVNRVVDIASTKVVARGIGGKGAAMLLNIAQAKSAPVADQRPDNSLTAFRVLRLDDQFGPSGAWEHERLAFAHFDVEGSELDVLQGAREVIARDLPIFTCEVATGMTEHAQRLLDEIAILGYEAYAFAEKCGENPDCRNLICLPKDRARKILRGVPSLAAASYLVNSSELLHKSMRWQLQAGREQGQRVARSASQLDTRTTHCRT
jgi:FkbM family methyltransferase